MSTLSLAGLLLTCTASAQLFYCNDTTFNPTDDGGYFSQGVYGAVILCEQPDGKLIMRGGSLDDLWSDATFRMWPDGTHDTTFEVVTDYMPTCAAVQADGKILLGGYPAGSMPGGLVRLDADGALDTTLQIGSGFNDVVTHLEILSDGRILASGSFETYDGNWITGMARILPDGAWDASFDTDFMGYNIYDFVVLPGNEIIAVGNQSHAIDRLNEDGSEDQTFQAPNSGSSIGWIDWMPDSSIVIGGAFTGYSGLDLDCLARMSVAGVLDTAYCLALSDLDISGFVFGNPYPDGRLMLSGSYSIQGPDEDFSIVLANGMLDTTFNDEWLSHEGINLSSSLAQATTDGSAFLSSVDLVVDDGSYRNGLVKLTPSDSLDTAFMPCTGFNGTVRAIQRLADGRIYVGGGFTAYNGHPCRGLVRLLPGGVLDTAFHVGNGCNAAVYSLALDANGDLLVGGAFDRYDGADHNLLMRVFADGTADDTFHPFDAGSGIQLNYGGVEAIVVQTDGRIIVAGLLYFAAFSDNIVRLFPSGARDTGFDHGGTAGSPHCLALQPDGKILVGGGWSTFNGNAAAEDNCVRLHTDGSLDWGFTIPGPFTIDDPVHAIAVQPNGRVLIGGQFHWVGGHESPGLGRLLSTGAPDVTFTNGSGVIARAIVPLLDGTSIVSGVHVMADGSQDPAMGCVNTWGGGGAELAYACALDGSDAIYIGGEFGSAGGYGRNRIARLIPTGLPLQGPDAGRSIPPPSLSLFPVPCSVGSGNVEAHIATSGAGLPSWLVRDALGRVVDVEVHRLDQDRWTLDVSRLAPGHYSVEVRQDDRRSSALLLIE